jgi:hypothetical protein
MFTDQRPTFRVFRKLPHSVTSLKNELLVLSLYSQMTHIQVPQWALSNCWKTHKGVTNDVSTLEALLSGLLHGVRMTPLQPLPTPTTLIYMSTHCNWAVISADWHSSTHSVLSFITPTGVECGLHIYNGLWNERDLMTWKVFSGVLCRPN